ncbi:MAG: hypothetical protein HC859_12205, partial [Bacteroidia bacterium]|nr:hypothetical protein [Bacteroidia bacterium]
MVFVRDRRQNNINYIRFSYETYTLSYQILNALSITYKVGGDSECAGTIAGEQSSGYHQLNVGGVRLSRIVTKDGHSAEFIPGNERTDITGTGLHALEGVHIRYNNTLTKSFSLIHDYSTNRLTLRSVSEHGNSGSTTPLVHKFDYYSELPPRTAKSIDHWGYANYASGNQSLV